MKKTIKEVVLKSVEELASIGLVDRVAMHKFDVLCLPKIKAPESKTYKFCPLCMAITHHWKDATNCWRCGAELINKPLPKCSCGATLYLGQLTCKECGKKQ